MNEYIYQLHLIPVEHLRGTDEKKTKRSICNKTYNTAINVEHNSDKLNAAEKVCRSLTCNLQDQFNFFFHLKIGNGSQYKN